MLRPTSLLVSLVVLMEQLPWPPESPKRLWGRPKTYAERLIRKALVIMIVGRLYTAYVLLAVLDQGDAVAGRLRPLVRTWPFSLPPHVGTPPGHAADELARDDWVLWAALGGAVAAMGYSRARDRRRQYAAGHRCRRVAQNTSRAEGGIPPLSIATEAGGSKSGGHDWQYGWKLHLPVTVRAIWISLAAELTVAKRGEQCGGPFVPKATAGGHALRAGRPA